MDKKTLAEELDSAAPQRETALTVGVFDGVHRGHRHLIAWLKDRAASRGLAAGVITIHPHPALVLDPKAPVAYLTTLEERVKLLRDAGADFVAPITFTREVAAMPARDFAALLVEKLRLRFLLIGPDFAMGRGREGGPEVLAALGREMGFEVESVGPLVDRGKVVSSSAVREALNAGDLEEVRLLLGRPFSITGPVVRGVERGKVMGFPTANIATGPGMALPPDGVYVTRAYLGEQSMKSVTNIGKRPTFSDGERSIEVFIMDFEGDIYGRELSIDVLKRLRGEVRFAGPDELAEQIGRDVTAADEYLDAHPA